VAERGNRFSDNGMVIKDKRRAARLRCAQGLSAALRNTFSKRVNRQLLGVTKTYFS
jgi:hypothetical protein